MIKNFGTIIKKAIEKHNLKQKDIAEQLNISPQTMSHYINNKRLPQLDCFFRLIEILDLNEALLRSCSFDDEHIEEFLLKTIPNLDDEQKRILFFLVHYFDKNINKKNEFI